MKENIIVYKADVEKNKKAIARNRINKKAGKVFACIFTLCILAVGVVLAVLFI